MYQSAACLVVPVNIVIKFQELVNLVMLDTSVTQVPQQQDQQLQHRMVQFVLLVSIV